MGRRCADAASSIISLLASCRCLRALVRGIGGQWSGARWRRTPSVGNSSDSLSTTMGSVDVGDVVRIGRECEAIRRRIQGVEGRGGEQCGGGGCFDLLVVIDETPQGARATIGSVCISASSLASVIRNIQIQSGSVLQAFKVCTIPATNPSYLPSITPCCTIIGHFTLEELQSWSAGSRRYGRRRRPFPR